MHIEPAALYLHHSLAKYPAMTVRMKTRERVFVCEKEKGRVKTFVCARER